MEPTEVEPFDEADFAKHPVAGQGLHRSRCAGGEERVGASATSSTPASSRAPAGSPAPTSTAATSSTWSPAATSRPTAPSRPPRSATATPARTARTARSRPPAASRWATSSSSAASTPTRWTSRCSTRTASSSPSRWAPTASASRAPSPRSPRAPTTSSASSGPARSPRPTSTWSPPARTSTIFEAAERIAHELSRQGIEVLYDDRAGKVSPGVKFKDAELIGVPTIVVVGKGLADGHVEVKDRAHRRPRGRRRRPRRRPRGPARPRLMPGIDAVIFDWGGTLTRWHDVDFHAESLALAQAVVNADHDPDESRARLHRAGSTIWGRSRDHQQSATVEDLFAEAGLDHDPELLSAYYEFWEPHTWTDPEVGPLFEALRADGVKVGVLSNTIWPRAWHEGFFERDGVRHLIDGDVYTSEIPWTKPSPRAFGAAMDAVGATDPARLRLRRGPALRRRLGRAQRRPARDPRPAQLHPGRPGRPHRGRPGRGGPPALGDPRRGRRLVLTLDCRFLQCRNVRNGKRRGRRTRVAHFCKEGAPSVPPHRAEVPPRPRCPGLSGPRTRLFRGASREFPGRRVRGPLPCPDPARRTPSGYVPGSGAGAPPKPSSRTAASRRAAAAQRRRGPTVLATRNA